MAKPFTTPASAAAEIARQVRRHDNERYLCALFAPAAERAALLALYAFNLEIARVRELVNEPLPGQIRLQWWRDSMAAIYEENPPRGHVGHHVVCQALAEAVRARGLSRSHLETLIDARERDLEDRAPADMPALLSYAEDSAATLVALALEILGTRDEAAGAAGRDVGIAWALTGLLRAIPFHARARRVYLPADRMAEAGLAREDYFALRPSEALCAVVAEVAAAARARLAAARALRPLVPRQALPALLPAVIAEAWLRQLARHGYYPLAPELAWRRAGVGRVLRVTLAAARRRY